jgi:hypothetical protein
MNVLEWAREAQIGQQLVYCSRTADKPYSFLPGEMRTARMAHNAGLVFLAQRRVDDVIEYTATRISTPAAKALRLMSHVA